MGFSCIGGGSVGEPGRSFDPGTWQSTDTQPWVPINSLFLSKPKAKFALLNTEYRYTAISSPNRELNLPCLTMSTDTRPWVPVHSHFLSKPRLEFPHLTLSAGTRPWVPVHRDLGSGTQPHPLQPESLKLGFLHLVPVHNGCTGTQHKPWACTGTQHKPWASRLGSFSFGSNTQGGFSEHNANYELHKSEAPNSRVVNSLFDPMAFISNQNTPNSVIITF